jgi:hypothetical protein
MDPDKRKRMVMFIGTMIVAIMFVTSYLAFGNNSSGTSTSSATTTIRSSTLVVSGEANATITNYTPNFRITLSNYSTANIGALNSTLSKLMSNGSISNMLPEGNGSFAIYSGLLDTYDIYKTISTQPIGNYIAWNATAVISLPQYLTLYYGSHAINVSVGSFVSQTGVSSISLLGSKIKVNVLAQVYLSSNTFPEAYTVYNNEIEVTAK